MSPEPGAPRETLTGTETVRSLGGIWIVADTISQMPGGGTGEMSMTLGYDPDKGSYVGTWIGSMVNWLCVYDRGELDASCTSLSLYTTGPSMTGGGGTKNYRDVITSLDADTRTLVGQVQDEQGNWQEMMKVEYRRKGEG